MAIITGALCGGARVSNRALKTVAHPGCEHFVRKNVKKDKLGRVLSDKDISVRKALPIRLEYKARFTPSNSGWHMTRNAILEELLVLLNEGPTGKSGVAFVLLQIRKVLEYQGKPTNYWALNFFCDWIAHTRLCGSGARKILKILDDQLSTFDTRNPEGIDPEGRVMSILSFDLLRRELRAFLNDSHLPTRWADDDFTWLDVVRLYAEQVQDIPLIVTHQKYVLKHIRKIEIVGLEPAEAFVKANPDQHFYGFEWFVTFNSGQAFKWRYTSNVMLKPEHWQAQGTHDDEAN